MMIFQPSRHGATARAFVMAALLALISLLVIASHAHAAGRHHWHHRARVAVDMRSGAVEPAPRDPFAFLGSLFRPPVAQAQYEVEQGLEAAGRARLNPRGIVDFVSRQPVIRGVGDVARVAEHFLGRRNFTRYRGIPWCASAVNAWLDMTGHRHVASLRAIDAIHDGPRVRRPEPGDLAVMRHHVAVFIGFGGRGFLAIGGNQGRAHRVTISTYPLSRVIAFVRPV